MRRYIIKLFQVLDQWLPYYLIAGLFLCLSSLLRMLEPKIIQIGIDALVSELNQLKPDINSADVVAQFFYNLLPSWQETGVKGWIFWICIFFVTIAVVHSSLRFIASAMASSYTEKSIKLLRDTLFSTIQAMPLKRLSEIPTGELIQRSTGDVSTIRGFIGEQTIEMMRLVAILIGALIMMILVHPTYTLISIGISPVIILTTFFFFKKESKVWQEHEDEQDKLTSIIQENLQGIRVVQAHATEAKEYKRFAAQNMVKLNIGLRQIDLHKWFWSFSDLLVHIQISLAIVVGGYFVLNAEITLGEYTSFIFYVLMVSWPMRGIGRIASQMGMASVAMQRITKILESEPESYEGVILEQKVGSVPIKFENVSFTYPETDRTVLKNLNLIIEPNKTSAIIGAPGCGKSTLLDLMMGFYEPESGSIFIGDKNVQELAKANVRKRIGLVHQEPFLFSDTIEQNLLLAKSDATQDELWRALDLAELSTFVKEQKDQLQTIVGEKGVSLSGGQKQRLALARILLSTPEIVILDDSTSALDTRTENAIKQALTKHLKNQTVLIISHRVNSFDGADTIFVMNEGSITASGSHDELLEGSLFYKQVVEIQLQLEDEIDAQLNSDS